MYTYKFKNSKQAQHMVDLLSRTYVDDISTCTDNVVRTTVSPKLFHLFQNNEKVLWL